MRAILVMPVFAAALILGCQNDAVPSGGPMSTTVPVTLPQPNTQVNGAGANPSAADEARGQAAIDAAVLKGGETATTNPAGKLAADRKGDSELGPALGAPSGRAKEPSAKAAVGPVMVAASVLQINDQFIVVEDVLAAGRRKLGELPKRINEELFRKQATAIVQDEIVTLVQESLVYEEAMKRLDDAQKEAIDKEVATAQQDMITEAGGSKTHLEQMMLGEGTTLEKAIVEYRRRVTAQLWLRQKFNPAIFTNRRMLWEYYDQHPSEFTSPKRVQMQMVSTNYKAYLPAEGGEPSEAMMAAARAKAKEQIDQAAAAIKAGRPFGDVVAKYSTGLRKEQGGVWPLMAEGSLRQGKVEAAAFALEEGKVSDVVQEEDGYYIVKVAKVEPGKQMGFEEAQDKIEDALRREQYRKLADEYYVKLRKGAIVVQSPDFVDLCVDRAAERFWGK